LPAVSAAAACLAGYSSPVSGKGAAPFHGAYDPYLDPNLKKKSNNSIKYLAIIENIE
jgi:hypothetical protein